MTFHVIFHGHAKNFKMQKRNKKHILTLLQNSKKKNNESTQTDRTVTYETQNN